MPNYSEALLLIWQIAQSEALEAQAELIEPYYFYRAIRLAGFSPLEKIISKSADRFASTATHALSEIRELRRTLENTESALGLLSDLVAEPALHVRALMHEPVHRSDGSRTLFQLAENISRKNERDSILLSDFLHAITSEAGLNVLDGHENAVSDMIKVGQYLSKSDFTSPNDR